MSEPIKHIPVFETKPPLVLENEISIASLPKKEKLYLNIDNYYLNNILESVNNGKLKILSYDSINELLMSISSDIKQKMFSLHLPNIGNLVKYKSIPKSNQNILDLKREKICCKLDCITKKKEELTKKTKDDGNSQILFDEFSHNLENAYNSQMENELNEIQFDKDEEDTKEETQGKEIIDETKIKNISFYQSIKFSSSKEINDTLIFDIEKLKDSGNLKIILELLSNNEYCKDILSPIFFENKWYIPLPDWAYSIKSLDLFNLSLIIILLIIILIISQVENINNIPNLNPIDDIYEQNKKKINELKEDPSIINILFSKAFLNDISNKISESYFEYSSIREVNKSDITAYFYKQLINLKEYIIKFKTIQEQIEKLFERITFYSFYDILNSYHFTYSVFRNYLLNYSVFQNINDKVDIFYKNILKENNILKPYKDEYVNYIKNKIHSHFSQKFFINFIDYGSSTKDLEINSSDRDILIFFEDEDKSKPISIEQFFNELFSFLKEEKNYLNVNKRYPKSIGYLIQIEYIINHNIEKNINIQKVNIDITFTKDKNYVEKIKEMTNLVKSDLKKYPNLKPLVLILKTKLENKGKNEVFKGGLNSLSIFFLAKHIAIIYEKENPSLRRLVYLFLNKYSKYDFTYGIDENGKEFPFDLNNMKDHQKRIIIKNPIIFKDRKYFTNTDDNIAGGCYKPQEIINLFEELLKYFLEN